MYNIHIIECKQFWNVVDKRDDSLISLFGRSGRSVPSTATEDAFNYFFASTFSPVNMNYQLILPLYYFIPMDTLTFDPFGIVKIISGLKLSSGADIDIINRKFLKSTKMYSSVILTKL